MTLRLADVLILRTVHELADTRTIARGEAYFQDGAVGRLDADECEVRADVQGTRRYRVRLAVGAEEELAHECNCPVGDAGILCKHAVAVALSWLEAGGEQAARPDDGEGGTSPRRRRTPEDQIREYLPTLGAEALREWLMEAVGRDRGIRDKLLLSANAKATSGNCSVATCRLRGCGR